MRMYFDHIKRPRGLGHCKEVESVQYTVDDLS